MRNALLCGIAMIVAGCSTAPIEPTTPLEVRVQTYGTGINAGSRVGIVADEFETGQARILLGEADIAAAMPKNATLSRLSEAATSRILELVAQLEQAPEPFKAGHCAVADALHGEHVVVAGDGRHAEIELQTRNGKARYARSEPFYDKVSRIVSLVSGDAEAPRDIVCLPTR